MPREQEHTSVSQEKPTFYFSLASSIKYLGELSCSFSCYVYNNSEMEEQCDI